MFLGYFFYYFEIVLSNIELVASDICQPGNKTVHYEDLTVLV